MGCAAKWCGGAVRRRTSARSPSFSASASLPHHLEVSNQGLLATGAEVTAPYPYTHMCGERRSSAAPPRAACQLLPAPPQRRGPGLMTMVSHIKGQGYGMLGACVCARARPLWLHRWCSESIETRISTEMAQEGHKLGQASKMPQASIAPGAGRGFARAIVVLAGVGDAGAGFGDAGDQHSDRCHDRLKPAEAWWHTGRPLMLGMDVILHPNPRPAH